MPAKQKTVHLAEYQPFTHLLDDVALTFRLSPDATVVLARLAFRPNPARPGKHALRLNGEGLTLLSCLLDGQPIKPKLDALGLTIAAKALPQGPFVLETEVQINPQANTTLDGLYMSRGCIAPSARRKAFARSPITPTAPM